MFNIPFVSYPLGFIDIALHLKTKRTLFLTNCLQEEFSNLRKKVFLNKCVEYSHNSIPTS
jgi:hypothetical protein